MANAQKLLKPKLKTKKSENINKLFQLQDITTEN